MTKPTIAVVIPTIREASYQTFLAGWTALFDRHNVTLLTVWDGEVPYVTAAGFGDRPFGWVPKQRTAHVVLDADADLIFNFTDSCRNLAFAAVAKYLPDVDVIITLDDDVLPIGDTIQAHLDQLNRRVPISVLSTASDGVYLRGFPYALREEAPVMLSHGIWEGVPDFDAYTQLVRGTPYAKLEYFQGPIPKGIPAPICGMNVAFRREALPYVYYAPMGRSVNERFGLDPATNVNRYGDIWFGWEIKRTFDARGWALVTGYAPVRHERASNVYKNVRDEAWGLDPNNRFWSGDCALGGDELTYASRYAHCRARWEQLISGWIAPSATKREDFYVQ